MSADSTDPRHLIVLGHPRPGSFNHQVAEAYRQTAQDCWHNAEIRDLYALGFDPLLRSDMGGSSADVEQELALVRACDVLVFVYPIWFGTPPAIIKGYVERVLGMGFRPESLNRGDATALYREKHFLSLSSSATTLPWLNERGQWASLRQAFDHYLAELFGFRSAEHVHFDAVVEDMRDLYARELLGRTMDAARSMCSKVGQEHRAAEARAALASRTDGD